jgi:hypothetical protein
MGHGDRKGVQGSDSGRAADRTVYSYGRMLVYGKNRTVPVTA